MRTVYTVEFRSPVDNSADCVLPYSGLESLALAVESFFTIQENSLRIRDFPFTLSLTMTNGD